jgi:hypothetical protein
MTCEPGRFPASPLYCGGFTCKPCGGFPIWYPFLAIPWIKTLCRGRSRWDRDCFNPGNPSNARAYQQGKAGQEPTLRRLATALEIRTLVNAARLGAGNAPLGLAIGCGEITPGEAIARALH